MELFLASDEAEGKKRVFLPCVGEIANYRNRCEEIAAAGYEGFSSRRDRVNARGHRR